MAPCCRLPGAGASDKDQVAEFGQLDRQRSQGLSRFLAVEDLEDTQTNVVGRDPILMPVVMRGRIKARAEVESPPVTIKVRRRVLCGLRLRAR